MKISLLPAFLSGLALCGAAACSSSDEQPVEPPIVCDEPGRRTVLVYMAAENSLGPNGFHYSTADSTEIMLGRRAISSDDRLLVFIDDGRGGARLYRVKSDANRPVLVKRWAQNTSACDPAMLREVLTLVKTCAPAKEYGLVMWSHASGWVPSLNNDYPALSPAADALQSEAPASAEGRAGGNGASLFSFGIDEGAKGDGDYGMEMDVCDLAEAVRQSGVALKYVFFDACLMQNLEVAYELRDVAETVVAAPVATPGAGANYKDQLKSGFFSDDAADIARTYFASVTSPSQASSYDDFGLCISAVRTAPLEALAQSVAEALPYSPLAADSLAQHGCPQFDDVPFYQPYLKQYFYRPHNYDAMASFKRLFRPADFEKVSEALEACIAYKASTPQVWAAYVGYRDFYLTIDTASPLFSAVSAFVPQEVYADNASVCAMGNLNERWLETAWAKRIYRLP